MNIEGYNTLNMQLDSLLDREYRGISNLSNASALLFNSMEDINWAGFYFYDGEKLFLGPFQGKVACSILKKDKGVCWCCVREKKTIIVEDVHAFPGHITCDADSKSEIVVPIIFDEVVKGVLDIDSPIVNRFNSFDKDGLERFVEILKKYITIEDFYG